MGATKRIVGLGVAALVAGVVFGATGACSSDPARLLGDDGVRERDATVVTDGAVDCSKPNDGCDCENPGEAIACGKVFRQSKDYIACSYGTRTCGADRTWGICVGDSIAERNIPGDVLTAKSLDNGIHLQNLGAATDCSATNPCDPTCTNFVDTPSGLDGGPDADYRIVDGAIVPNSVTTTCPVGTLFCNIVACPPGSSTDFKGQVFDPAGRNPLAGVTVYVPTTNDPLPPIPVGPYADACGGVPQVLALASAVTDVNGFFTLKNVPSGINVPVVIQLGKWRRQFTLLAPQVTACVTNDLTALTDSISSTIGGITKALLLPKFRLPATKAEGNIPQMAVALGGSDQFACLFPKIGLDFSEFTDNTKTGKMHVFSGLNSSGNTYGGLNGVTPPAARTNLWNSYASISKYDIVLASCEGATNLSAKPATSMQAVHDYLDAGGRFFATHFHYAWFKNNPKVDFQGVANWTGYDRQSNGTGTFTVVTTTARGITFRDWLSARGALNAPVVNNRMTIGEWREDMYEPLGNSLSWIENPKGTLNDEGNTRQSTKYMTFNTPIANAPANQYGKAVISDIHVSPGDSTTNVPSSCEQSTLLTGLIPCLTDLQCGGSLQCIRGRCLNGMTAQEKALEYLFFDLGACISDAPAPIPSTIYSDASLTRDYVATCPAQKQPRWNFFDYQGNFPGSIANDPAGTSMELRFVTATTQAALAATAKPAAAALTVRGKQTVSTWTGIDVAPTLPSARSQSYLRVFIDLKASTDRFSAPTLTAWRQGYSCVDAE